MSAPTDTAALVQAEEDRDSLAAYITWRLNPAASSPPMTLSDLLQLLARLGHDVPWGR